jgi:hypothetical protein
LQTAQKTSKNLDAHIAAQEAVNNKKLMELAAKRKGYPSDIEVNVLLFNNIRCCLNLIFSFAGRSATMPKLKASLRLNSIWVSGRYFFIRPMQ